MKRLAVFLLWAATIAVPWAGTLAAPGDLVLVSATGAGMKANGESLAISISADGTHVAFSSTTTNLDPGDTDTVLDVYVKDLTTETVSLVSTSASGAKGNGRSDAPDPVRVRDSLTYQLVVTNHGPSNADIVKLVDSLPRETRLVSATAPEGSCSAARDTVTCTFLSLAPGDSATATVVVTVRQVGTIANTAMVSSAVADPVSANNAASETTQVVR